MPEHDPHSSPIKTPKQLIIVVLLAFLVPIVVIGLLSQLFTSTRHDASGDEQRVLERIKPVGTVVFARAERLPGPDEVTADQKQFDASEGRSGIRRQAALCALELLMP